VRWRAKRGRPIVARKDDYWQRYKVERSFAWLGNFRRLLIRWEYLFVVYRSFFAVALLLVCLKPLSRVVEGPQEATHGGNRKGRRG